MRKQFSLNDLYSQYAEGLINKKKFEGLIFENILKDFRRFNLFHWGTEECADFVSWLYPRFSKAVDSYQDTGSSFEGYLGSIIRWSAKEYHSRMASNKITEYASWAARSSEQYVYQDEPEYYWYGHKPEKTVYRKNLAVTGCRQKHFPPDKPAPEQRIWAQKSVPAGGIQKSPRQLLILVLKCYNYVSDDFLDRIAPLLKTEKESLRNAVDKLREMCLVRDEKLRRMRERIHCQFYRCFIYEKKLEVMMENSLAFARIQSRLQRARLRLETMRKRLAGTRPDATNRQIAEVLGISKGTVDSSLHALKLRWNNNPNKNILN